MRGQGSGRRHRGDRPEVVPGAQRGEERHEQDRQSTLHPGNIMKCVAEGRQMVE
jgi:hypothetical protein